jgi:hypothetical protein
LLLKFSANDAMPMAVGGLCMNDTLSLSPVREERFIPSKEKDIAVLPNDAPDSSRTMWLLYEAEHRFFRLLCGVAVRASLSLDTLREAAALVGRTMPVESLRDNAEFNERVRALLAKDGWTAEDCDEVVAIARAEDGVKPPSPDAELGLGRADGNPEWISVHLAPFTSKEEPCTEHRGRKRRTSQARSSAGDGQTGKRPSSALRRRLLLILLVAAAAAWAAHSRGYTPASLLAAIKARIQSAMTLPADDSTPRSGAPGQSNATTPLPRITR